MHIEENVPELNYGAIPKIGIAKYNCRVLCISKDSTMIILLIEGL